MKANKRYLNLIKEKYRLFPKNISPFNRKMGIELEFHIVPIDGSKPDMNILKSLLNKLLEQLNFSKIEFDFEGHCIKGEKDQDIISYEASYTIIEISIAPFLDVHSICDKAYYYINIIKDFLKQYDLTLLPIGINPFSWALEIPYLKNEYWNAYTNFLQDFNPQKKYSYNNFGALFCSTQIHLDVSLKELPIFFTMLNQLNWVKALLFSNSPNLIKKERKCYCLRDLLWQDSACALHLDNVGISNNSFDTHEEVFATILKNSIYFVVRDNKRIYFQPYKFIDFLQKEHISGWKIEDKEKIEVKFQPQESDIQYIKPYNATILTPKGTVEIRSECIQPFEDIMSHLAFHLGLINNLEKISNYLSVKIKYFNKYSFKELRQKAIFKGYEIQKDLNLNIKTFMYELLLLIREGLRIRGKKEEKYLNCLFERLRNKTNPAMNWIEKHAQGYEIIDVINNNFVQKAIK